MNVPFAASPQRLCQTEVLLAAGANAFLGSVGLSAPFPTWSEQGQKISPDPGIPTRAE